MITHLGIAPGRDVGEAMKVLDGSSSRRRPHRRPVPSERASTRGGESGTPTPDVTSLDARKRRHGHPSNEVRMPRPTLLLVRTGEARRRTVRASWLLLPLVVVAVGLTSLAALVAANTNRRPTRRWSLPPSAWCRSLRMVVTWLGGATFWASVTDDDRRAFCHSVGPAPVARRLARCSDRPR